MGAAALAAIAASGRAPAAAQALPPPGLSNLGIAVSDTVALDGGGIAFTAAESQQGSDLNGDGDTDDNVIHRADKAATVTNLAIAAYAPGALDGGGFVFKAAEPGQGGDLNGDGDTDDYVVHRVDPTGTVTNLAIATHTGSFPNPAALDGGGFVFNASEPGQGSDLNGDGDTDDYVIHRVDPTGTVTNLTIAASERSVALDGGGLTFGASEAGQGSDLNGDGDTDDNVVHRVDPTGTVTNLAIADYAYSVALDGGGFTFGASEAGQGSDLNGDGDTDDAVVHRVDPTGAVTNLAIAESLGSAYTALDGGGFAFTTHESHQGADLNGDGDTGDFVVHRVDPTGTVTNLAIAESGWGTVALDGGGFTFNAAEAGQGSDLNGDGDTSDTVAHRVDPAGAVTNLAISAYAYAVALDGGGFVFDASEHHQGADLTGDGDTVDMVLHRVDPGGAVANLTVADSLYGFAALDGGGLAFSASEAGQGADLNGDGDTNDAVLHRMAPAGTVTSLAIADSGSGFRALDGGGLAFSASEAGHGADLNGDGDTNDAVLHMTAGGLTVANDAIPTSVTEPGGSVTYRVSVTNTSLVDAVTIGSLVDDVHGPIVGDGDCQAGTVLAPGAGCTFDYTATVTGNAGSVRTSTVTAAGTDDDGVAVTGSDAAAVTVTDSPGTTSRNLGIAGPHAVALDGGGLASTEAEYLKGVDLNGDGDLEDRVLHRVGASGAVTNLGIAVGFPGEGDIVALDGGGIAFTAHEGQAGTDLNGDGDTSDNWVLHRVDAAGTVTNLAIARAYQPTVALDGGGFAFLASESDEGADLDGDGDTDDAVVHRVDGAGAISSLRRPGSSSGWAPVALGGGGFAFMSDEPQRAILVAPSGGIDYIYTDRSSLVALDGGGLVYLASEEGTDFNDDGDTDDDVLHRVDAAGRITNLAIAGGSAMALDGGGFAFTASAGRQLHRVDAAGVTTGLAVAGEPMVALDGGGFTFGTSEEDEGSDLNGDGDTNDFVLGRVDATGTVTGLGIAYREVAALEGGGFVFTVYEPVEGQDLNGDGDTFDEVLHRVDAAGGLANLGIAVETHSVVALDGGGFAFLASEAGADLNGDSDQTDAVVHRVDATGSFINLAIAGYAPIVALDGGGLAFAASEFGQGADLNGDGHTMGTAVHMTGGGLAVANGAGPTTVAEPGGDVTYTVAVTNTSLVDAVTIGSMTDDVDGPLVGDGDCQTGTVLAPGARCTFEYTATVTGNAGSARTSTVTAAGTDDDGVSVSGSDAATVVVTDVWSSITVTDDASPAMVAEPGGDVTHTVAVTNTSPADAVLLESLTDSVSGDLSGRGDCTVPQTIAPSATYTCTYTATVTAGAGTTHISLVTAVGTDDDGASVSGSDEAAVLVTEAPGPVVVTSSGGDDIAVELNGPGAIFTAEPVDPPAGVTPPPGASFPYGLVGFTVVGVAEGATATVTIDFPAPLADPFTYFKVQDGAYVDATSIATHDNGRVTLTLVDNGPFDSAPEPGVITDPGGPATFAPSTGELVISKVFDPLTSGIARTFTINWSCDNATAGSVQLAGGASATVAAIPVGTVCSVSESRPGGAPSGWYYQSPAIAGSPATIAAGAPATVTVTNSVSRLTRPLRINMTLNGAPAGFAGVFMIHVECSGDGGIHDRVISWPLVRSATIAAVPTNTQCTVSEPSVSAPPAGFGWAAPTFAPNPVTIPATGTATVTVTNRLIDTAAPTATFTSPGPNNPLLRGRPIVLNGNVTDNVGVTSVRVAIRNTNTGRYLQPNGSWATGYATLYATLGAQGARNTTWRISRALPDGNYSIELVPTDAAGNTPMPRPARSFRVDAP